MLAFLFLLLPLSFILYCLRSKDKQILIPALIGFVCAVFLCAFRAFFGFTHRVIPYAFSGNLIYYVTRDLIMPVVLCAAYYIISRDTWEYKVNCFFPLICAFYMVYLPYSVVANTETVVYSVYDLFVKPFIILAMVFQLSIDVKLLYEGIKEKSVLKIAVNVLTVLIFYIFPVFLDAFYIMGYPFIMVIGLSVLYIIAPAVFSVYELIKK